MLAEFLVAKKRPKKTKNYPELNGFLYAIACSPENIKPAVWLPMVFNRLDGNFKDEQEKQEIEKGIFDELSQIERNIENQVAVLANYFRPSDELLENFDEDSPIAHWGRGFLDGVDCLQPVWDAYLPTEMKSELSIFINLLSFFANKKQTKIECQKQNIENLSFEVYAETAIENFNMAAVGYANVGLGLRAEILAQQ